MEPIRQTAAVGALVGLSGGGRTALPPVVPQLAPALLRPALNGIEPTERPAAPPVGPALPVSDRDVEAGMRRLRGEILTALVGHIRENNCGRREIAARMGVTPGRVSQILSGHDNLTLRTIATLSVALRVELHVELAADEIDRAG